MAITPIPGTDVSSFTASDKSAQEADPSEGSGSETSVSQGAPGSDPWLVTAPSATWADHSGTITAGGTSQQLMAANANRRGFFVQNLSAEDLFIMDGAAAMAGQPSLKIPPDGLYETPANGTPTTAINIIGATTGSAFSAREF